MNRFIEGVFRIFNFGVAAYVVLALLAAAFILGAWCVLWTMLSNLSN